MVAATQVQLPVSDYALNFNVLGKNFGNTPVSDARLNAYLLFSDVKNPTKSEFKIAESVSANRVPPTGEITIPIGVKFKTSDIKAGLTTFTVCLEFVYADIYGQVTVDPFQFDLVNEGAGWSLNESIVPDIRTHKTEANKPL